MRKFVPILSIASGKTQSLIKLLVKALVKRLNPFSGNNVDDEDLDI